MTRSESLVEFIKAELLTDPTDDVLEVDDELLTTARIDSLGLMRLIAFIGSNLELEVPYEDILIENFRSVQAIDNYLETRS